MLQSPHKLYGIYPMASHFKWYPPGSEVVVPFNARYEFPSEANKAELITSRIPPKSGSIFSSSQQIRVEFPAQGYVNPANTMLEFDLTLTGYQGASTNAQVVRMQNNIQSIFTRARLMYGSTPTEDIIHYNNIVRNLTEWTSAGATMDATSIREGIGGVVYGQCTPTDTGGNNLNLLMGGLVNTRQAYIQGIDTRINLTTGGASGTFPTTIPISSSDINFDIGQGWGVVPNQQAGNSTLSGDTSNGFKTICTRRYQVQFGFGLFNQDKLIPTKYMASQLAIELTLAPEAECIFVESAPSSYTGATPTYQVTNVNLIPEVLQFDSSYDAMFLKGLREGGVPIKYSSFHTFIFPMGSSQVNALILERSRSVKALFAVQRRATPLLTTDSGAGVFDTNFAAGTTNSQGSAQTFQYRIGNRFFPASPCQLSIGIGSSVPNSGAEAYAELEKALNIVGDYRLNTANNTLRWGLPCSQRSATIAAQESDYTSIVASFSATGQPNPAVYAQPPYSQNLGSSCFAMATSLETSNGVEISGLNAEEQSDISLQISYYGPQSNLFNLEVYTYYDAMIVLKENNILELIQ